MSSFKKASKSVSGQPTDGRTTGVKPWMNGLSLVSSGNRELDDILGGGHVLGSLCLLHEDEHSNYADTILAYSLAEAISQKHKVLLIVQDVDEAKAILSALPFNLNKGTLSTDKKKNETYAENTKEDKKKHLKIAWQYGKYIKDVSDDSDQKIGYSSSYCSSYDLSNRLQSSVFEKNMPRVYCVAEGKALQWNSNGTFSLPPRKTSASIVEETYNAIQSFQEIHSNTQANPIRIFFPHFESFFGKIHPEDRMMGANLLLRIKHLMQGSFDSNQQQSKIQAKARMTTFVSVQPSCLHCYGDSQYLQTLNSIADTVLGVESFAGHADAIPVEFRYFCGFFFVHKLHQICSIAPHRASASRYGLKRDRRKLHIEPLHLPPEDSRASKFQSETSLGVKQDKGKEKDVSVNKSIANQDLKRLEF